MQLYIAKDHIEGGGLVENLTVIILIPGILTGLYTFLKYKSAMKPSWTAHWLLMWILACTYFAGEEASWGQWFFEWETPAVFSQVNDQNETNLHNTSTWLDQKPRTLVELWILITGLIFPLIHFFKKQTNLYRDWKYWIHPIPSLFTAALFFTSIRFAGWLGQGDLKILYGSSEFREFSIALFLSLFLLSYFIRLRVIANLQHNNN